MAALSRVAGRGKRSKQDLSRHGDRIFFGTHPDHARIRVFCLWIVVMAAIDEKLNRGRVSREHAREVMRLFLWRRDRLSVLPTRTLRRLVRKYSAPDVKQPGAHRVIARTTSQSPQILRANVLPRVVCRYHFECVNARSDVSGVHLVQ